MRKHFNLIRSVYTTTEIQLHWEFGCYAQHEFSQRIQEKAQVDFINVLILSFYVFQNVKRSTTGLILFNWFHDITRL